MTTIYTLLNQEAKNWWHHKNLREQGRSKEARIKEREHIRDSVKNLRECFWFSVGRGGFTLHGRYIPSACGGSQGQLQGYGKGTTYAKALAVARPNIPRVDSTIIPDKLIFKTNHLPMAQDREDKFDQPNDVGAYNSMQYCHLGIVLACYEALGAEVYWGSLNVNEWKDKATSTIKRVLK